MKTFGSLLILASVILAGPAAALASQPEDWTDLSAPGKKNWINTLVYFTYKFTTPPRMGTVILKVQVFDKPGKKNTSVLIQAEYGMPAMPGAHASGRRDLSLNKAGNYLLPLNLVMPGEWELKLTFFKDGQPVFRGRAKFDV